MAVVFLETLLESSSDPYFRVIDSRNLFLCSGVFCFSQPGTRSLLCNSVSGDCGGGLVGFLP